MIYPTTQVVQPLVRPTKKAKRKKPSRSRSSFGGYGIYNFLKLQWEAKNPDATYEKHQIAMRRIAHESGV